MNAESTTPPILHSVFSAIVLSLTSIYAHSYFGRKRKEFWGVKVTPVISGPRITNSAHAFTLAPLIVGFIWLGRNYFDQNKYNFFFYSLGLFANITFWCYVIKSCVDFSPNSWRGRPMLFVAWLNIVTIIWATQSIMALMLLQLNHPQIVLIFFVLSIIPLAMLLIMIFFTNRLDRNF